MQCRHRCYMDSRPSRTAATKAIVNEAGANLGADEAMPASTFSSLRTQVVLADISAGQTTRLKFALCYVRPTFV